MCVLENVYILVGVLVKCVYDFVPPSRWSYPMSCTNK